MVVWSSGESSGRVTFLRRTCSDQQLVGVARGKGSGYERGEFNGHMAIDERVCLVGKMDFSPQSQRLVGLLGDQ